MGMAEDVVEDLRARIAKTLDDLRRELAKVRTGRANPALLEGVRVDYYGTLSPLQNVANVTVPALFGRSAHTWLEKPRCACNRRPWLSRMPMQK